MIARPDRLSSVRMAKPSRTGSGLHDPVPMRTVIVLALALAFAFVPLAVPTAVAPGCDPEYHCDPDPYCMQMQPNLKWVRYCVLGP